MTSVEQKRKGRRQVERTLQFEQSSMAERVRRSVPKEASFVIIGGMDVGVVIPIVGDRIVLGRDPSCDAVLRDDGISRRHAEVTRDGGSEVSIRDLDSTNGVFLDGRRISRATLRDGDKVLLGRRTIIKFTLQDAIDRDFQERMYESAVRDPLTGAFNRRHFEDQLRVEISFALRHDVPLTLLMFDIDYFKRVNDTWGHQVGDQVLVAIAQTVSDTIRAEDMFARYGGEEFVVVARGIGEVGGLAFGERLRRQVEDLVVVAPDGERIPITISVGAATLPGGVEIDPAAFVERADRHLYEAKRGGRNRVSASSAG